MKINLREVTCEDRRAYTNLIHYMMKISQSRNFDEYMPIAIYVDDKKDLVGFESLKYRMQYVNNAHKLYEVINSHYTVDPVPYVDFKEHMLSIGANLPF